ncbi:sigma-70 family RNA polymerase sigma factor [Paenibacillus tarimensis]
MSEQTQLQLLGTDTRPMFDRFWEIIAPFQVELWNYCRKITGDPWDGEDLYQDTIMKSFTSLSALSIRTQILHPKSYLFRVATNHWIDICRRQQRIKFEDYTDEQYSTNDPSDLFDVYEAIEYLLQYLPPKQSAAVVLMDAFRFTASEAAEVIGTTEGAVQAALFRGRSTLRKLVASEIPKEQTHGQPDANIVQKYVDFFNERDFNGIAGLLAENAVFSFVTQSSKEFGRDTIMKASHNPSHYQRSDLMAVMINLWEKTAVAFYKTIAMGEPIALNEVLTIETEDNRIVGIKCYCFCPEFMEAASEKLGVPRESAD